MNRIQAIGFDLFNTLITCERHTLHEAMGRLTLSLRQSGLALGNDSFYRAHREAALKFLEEAHRGGRETHNRFWISAALQAHGYHIPPDDPRVSGAVDAYFSAFLENCRLIPDTQEMLGSLRGRYRLGLLSNFTHAPAAWEILGLLGLTQFFDVVLISGELGYRKPHPLVFDRLIEGLGVAKTHILFVGDDPEADIEGARRAELLPVWTTYVRDQNIPTVPAFAYSDDQDPDTQVPRISTWEELLVLLDEW